MMTRTTYTLPVIVLAILVGASACNYDRGATSPEAAALTAEDREAIEALARDYSNHALAGDLESWAGLYHAGAVRMHPGMPDWEGRDRIRETIQALGISVHTHEMSPVEVNGNRDLAYMRGTYRVAGTMDAGGEEIAIQDEGSWLAVVRRDEDDAWRFYRWSHNSNLPPAPVVEEE